MKFRFYITSTLDGNIQGTDDKSTAESLAQSEDFFVVDSTTGEWVTPAGYVAIGSFES